MCTLFSTTPSQVFVGKIPRDVYEDELVPLFSRHGRIYEMRLMMDFNGNNRGYAFVVFSTKKEAQNAVRMLNNYEVLYLMNVLGISHKDLYFI